MEAAVWRDNVRNVVQRTSLNDDNSTKPIYRCFHRGHFKLPCPGSETIVRLFAHFQVQALHITHAMSKGPTSTVMIGDVAAPRYPEPQATALTAADVASVERFLDEVLSQLEVVVEQSDRSGPDAMVNELWDQNLPTLPGIASRILVGPHLIAEIEEAFADNNTVAQQHAMFHLARVLFHEFVHVMDVASRSPESCKTGGAFLGNARTEEIGFEAEAILFGGALGSRQYRISLNIASDGAYYVKGACKTIGPDGKGLPLMVVAQEWPVKDIVDWYQAEAQSQDKKFLTREGPALPDVSREWKVPFSYITQLFQDAFWRNSTVARAGNHHHNALHPLRSAGFLTERYGELKVDLYPGHPAANGFVPDGYGLVQANGSLMMMMSRR